MIGLIIAFAVGLVLSISLTPLFIRYLVHNHGRESFWYSFSWGSGSLDCLMTR